MIRYPHHCGEVLLYFDGQILEQAVPAAIHIANPGPQIRDKLGIHVLRPPSLDVEFEQRAPLNRNAWMILRVEFSYQ